MNEEVYVCKDCLGIGDIIEMEWSRLLERHICPECYSEDGTDVLIDEIGEVSHEQAC